MVYANDPKDYNVKKKRVDDAANLRIPDKVPVFGFASTWGFAYSGMKINDVRSDAAKIADGNTSYLKEFYMDGVFGAALLAPLTMYDVLKPEKPQYGISEDGYSLQHFECAEMLPEEYPQLIADPGKYIKDVILPRRYPILNEPYPKNYNALRDAYKEMIFFINAIMLGAQTAQEKYGVPVLVSGAMFVPIDLLFDFFRGFKGLLTDIRRCPEKVTEACESLVSYVEKTKLATVKKGDYIGMPLHMATYMSVKQFEKIYWPSLKICIEKVREKGARPLVALENDWTNYLDPILDLPDNAFTAIMEYGDLKAIKNKYGKKISIVGGMPCSILRYSSKNECIDYAKKVIDDMAPNGGYLFATDKILLCPNDVNNENYKAVIKTVKEYGTY